MIELLKEAEAVRGAMIALRREFHSHPEVGNSEFLTTETLQSYLQSLGIEVLRPLPTGLIGILKGGKPGGTVMLRSDIDALPVQEKTGLTYASVNDGVMHACGHDIHMASLCGAAKLLSMHREELEGNVVFLLQPDEEQDGGAERMIAAGALDHVDAVFGAHINPSLPTGTIGVRYGKFYAAAAKFDVTVHGKGCHGAEPENGIDALYAAACMCARLKQLTKDYNGTRAVVTVGSLHSGTVRNIINDTAVFNGIIRTFGTENREARKQDLLDIIHAVEQETGCTAEVTLVDGYPGVVNHDEETALVEKTALAMFGKEHVVTAEETMTTEDFGFYLLAKPGSFYHLGTTADAPLHSPYLAPDEDAIVKGAAFHAAVLMNWLHEHAGKENV